MLEIFSLGVSPMQHAIHHKSHIPKCMCVYSSSFLPQNNSIEKGGKVVKLSLVCCGKMLEAKRDTYKRVYWNDGTFHYPKIPKNWLWFRGQNYYASLNVTGSNKGSERNPKFALKDDFYMQHKIPELKALTERLNNERPDFRHIINYQTDGAGPHWDKELI